MTLVLDTPEQIDLFRFLALRSALKLECLGMRGRTNAYATVKTEFGLKGNRKAVLEQMEEIIKQIKEEAA